MNPIIFENEDGAYDVDDIANLIKRVDEFEAEMKAQAAFTHQTVEKYRARITELEAKLDTVSDECSNLETENSYLREIIEDSGVDADELLELMEVSDE